MRRSGGEAVLGGDRGVVDLVGTMGLYQISSMMVALDKTPVGQCEAVLHPVTRWSRVIRDRHARAR